jgi:hypothetical protein
MTLFGAGLFVGGVGLLLFAWIGARSRRRPRPDWAALDRSRELARPLIRPSELLEETVPLQAAPPEETAALAACQPPRTPI